MIIWIHFVWLFSWSWWCVVIRLDVHHEKAVQICSVLDCLKPLAIPLAWSLQLGSWASHFWSSEDGGSSSQPEEFELNSQQRQCSYNIIIYELHLPDSGTWQSLRLSGMVCTQFCTAKSSTAIRSLRTKGAQRLDRHKTLDDRTSNDWLKSTWYLRSTDLYRSLQISTTREGSKWSDASAAMQVLRDLQHHPASKSFSLPGLRQLCAEVQHYSRLFSHGGQFDSSFAECIVCVLYCKLYNIYIHPSLWHIIYIQYYKL